MRGVDGQSRLHASFMLWRGGQSALPWSDLAAAHYPHYFSAKPRLTSHASPPPPLPASGEPSRRAKMPLNAVAATRVIPPDDYGEK